MSEILDGLATSPQGAVKFFVFSSKKGKTVPHIRGVWIDKPLFRLCWQSKESSSDFESFSIHEISEIRRGCKHKDFSTTSAAEIITGKENLCFTILYGKHFRLKSLSLVARNEAAFSRWVDGLDAIVNARQIQPTLSGAHTDDSTYANQQTLTGGPAENDPHYFYTPDTMANQYLEAGFRNFKKEYINMKDFQNFLRSSGLKAERHYVKRLFEAVVGDSSLVNKEGFKTLYRTVLKQPAVEAVFNLNARADGHMTVDNLQKFLVDTQDEEQANDIAYVTRVMKTYLKEGVARTGNELYWTVDEFVDYLYSPYNDVYDVAADTPDDMDKPLSQYLISSSHNTYLMGDQLRSESSVEAYIRCLRMNARCLELDTWDGSNGEPIITHGNTLCTTVPFRDVVEAIMDHAWDVSDYPLVLSLENHCSPPCQQIMADVFKEVMGDTIQMQVLDPTPGALLPSPNQFKRKILLKDKKNYDPVYEGGLLGDSVTSMTNILGSLMSKDSMENTNDTDVGDLKNGHLYMKFGDQDFMLYYFVIHPTYIEYVDVDTSNQDNEDDDDNDDIMDGKEDFWGETWFHPNECGRTEAHAILRKANVHGAFLVRTRSTYPYYALSYWDQLNLDQHVLLRTSPDNEEGKKEYWLVDTPRFTSMLDLIEFYQHNTLLTADGDEMVLTTPLGAAPILTNEQGISLYDWYDPTMAKQQAEYHLKRTVKDGSFLVRKATDDANAYTISFRAGRGIKHCRLQREGRFFVVAPGLRRFETIPDLIEYYQRHVLYRKTKLTKAVNKMSAQAAGAEVSKELYMQTYCDTNYVDINQDGATPMYEVVRAKYDYESDDKKKISFTKGTMIRVVSKDDGLWWRGECPGGSEGLFPSTYVEPVVEDKGDVLIQGDDGEPVARRIMLNEKIKVEKLSPTHFSIETPTNDTFVIATAPTDDGAGAPPDSEAQIDTWVESINKHTVPHKPTASALHSTPSAMSAMSNVSNDVLGTQRSQLRVPELSDLISYFQSVRFTSHSDAERKNVGYNVSSFAEHIARKLGTSYPADTIAFNIRQFSRIYPRGRRVDSSNYDPMTLWLYGCQLVALNYQTPGRHMLTNRGLFRMNNNTGFVLKPPSMLTPGSQFDPDDYTTFGHDQYGGVKPLKITIEILAGKHLNTIKGTPTPFVEMEVVGTEIDSEQKYRTSGKTSAGVQSNGLCPHWEMEVFQMTILYPDLALIRLSVMDEGVFGEPQAFAHACIPVRCLRGGLRSIPLVNGLGEPLEMSALLIRCELEPHQLVLEEKVPYSAMGQDDMDDINRQIATLTAERAVAIAKGDSTNLDKYDEQIRALFTKAKRTAINRNKTLAAANNNIKQRDSSRSTASAISSKSTKKNAKNDPASRVNSSKLNAHTTASNGKGRSDYVEAVSMEEYARKGIAKGGTLNKKAINGHVFKTVSVGVPSTCHHCKKSILGSIRSTSKCTNKQCSILVHKKCRELCSPCVQ